MRKGRWSGRHRDLKEGVVVRKGINDEGGPLAFFGSDDFSQLIQNAHSVSEV